MARNRVASWVAAALFPLTAVLIGCSSPVQPSSPGPMVIASDLAPQPVPSPAPPPPPVPVPNDEPTPPANEPATPVEPVAAPPPEPTPAPAAVPMTARYSVVFESVWSPTLHPIDFPSSAHYSPLIGGTHNSRATFWREGALASEGIRRMAERGATSPLDAEIMQAIAAGTAERVLLGPALGRSPGTATMDFEVSQQFPLVTLVTMVAPSPDWFTGVSGLRLFDNGQWLAEVRVTVHGLDAGTDSGATYTSPDQETAPRAVVTRLEYPLAAAGGAPPLGTFTFRRIQ